MVAHVKGIVPALVLAGLVGVIGPSARHAEGAEARAVTERVFPLKPGGELAIESQNGRITVEAWNRPEARVQITRIVRANDEKRARERWSWVLDREVEVGRMDKAARAKFTDADFPRASSRSRPAA